MIRDHWSILVPLIAAVITVVGTWILRKSPRSPKKPLPEKYESLTPGTPLSLVKPVYSGKFNPPSAAEPYYRIPLKDTFFRMARCFFFKGRVYPQIHRTVLYFKKGESSSKVKSEALLKFGSNKVISTFSGCLIWIVAGFRVKISDTVYEVQKATISEKVGVFLFRFLIKPLLG